MAPECARPRAQQPPHLPALRGGRDAQVGRADRCQLARPSSAFCVRARLGMASCAPALSVAKAPAQLAWRIVFTISALPVRRAAKDPAKASPAPTVSTGRTFRVGTLR